MRRMARRRVDAAARGRAPPRAATPRASGGASAHEQPPACGIGRRTDRPGRGFCTASAYVGTALIGLALGLGAAWLRGAGRARWATGLLVGAPLVLYLLVAPAQARGAGALALAVVAGGHGRADRRRQAG
jgi:hypothetical protein